MTVNTMVLHEDETFRVVKAWAASGSPSDALYYVVRESDGYVLGEFTRTGRGDDMSVSRYEHPTQYMQTASLADLPHPVCTGIDMAVRIITQDLDRQ